MVTLKDESTNEQVDDRKASGRIHHNLEILVNLGHSIADDTIRFISIARETMKIVLLYVCIFIYKPVTIHLAQQYCSEGYRYCEFRW